ncbi:MAG TPA: hypothetical protein PKV96_04045 [Candidatus Saccharimonas sp.]|nr:hypothetical protein [Candidatus Saccharimonas sp.]
MTKAIVATILLMLIVVSPLAHAEDVQVVLTDQDIALIRTNCVGVQSSMQRVHSSDALARYNLAQQYNIISTKLMAPMNSRVSLNKLNGVAMTQTTVDFDETVSEFKLMYQQYEETTSRALKMNCKDQPVSFYDTLVMARSQKAAVRDAINRINILLQQYDTQFDQLRAQALQKTTGVTP